MTHQSSDQPSEDQGIPVTELHYIPMELLEFLDEMVKESGIVGKNQAETRGKAASLLIREAFQARREGEDR